MLSVILVLGIFFLSLYLYNDCKRPSKYPPGPLLLPLLGNLHQVKKLAAILGGQHLAFSKLAEEYNTTVIGLKLTNQHIICADSYASIKKICTSEEFEGRPDNFFFRLRCFGSRKGITSTDGEIWRQQRMFLVTHLRALGFGKSTMEQMVKDEIREVIEKIFKNLNDVDIAAVLAPSVLNILWTLTTGNNLKNDQRVEKLLQLLTLRSKAFDMCGGTLNMFPWLRFIVPDQIGYSLIKSINLDIKNIIMETINTHKNKWKEGCHNDIIYSYLTEMKKQDVTKITYSEDQLLMICLDVFIAGSTTTGNAINFALLSMILYPNIQEKVYQCIHNVFGDNEILYCDKERVPYVEAVLLECQRMFPVVALSGPRRVLKQTHIEDYIIPKDTTVLMNLYSVHNDKDFWKDPEKFRPERFLNKDGNLTNQDRILTFGLGKRRCLGDALAKTCIFLFFVEIIRKFKIEIKNGEEMPSGKPIPGITLTPEKYKATFLLRS